LTYYLACKLGGIKIYNTFAVHCAIAAVAPVVAAVTAAVVFDISSDQSVAANLHSLAILSIRLLTKLHLFIVDN
jgi:hypothetical protein